MTMNLRQLEHFLAVVEEGTLGRASRKLNLSQPAISKSVQKLEEQLGAPLLERGRRGMTATAFGRTLVRHARVIRAQVDQARQEIDALRGLTQGNVTFACGPSVAIAVAPLALQRFSARYPAITVNVVTGLADIIFGALAEGIAEFVVAPNQPSLPAVQPELLYVDQNTVVGRVGHPILRRRRVTLADLAQQRWVLPQRNDLMRQYFDTQFLAAGLTPPAPVWESNSVPLIKQAAAGSDALTFLPLPAIRDATNTLAALRNSPCTWERSMLVFRRSPGQASPAAEALIAELRGVAAEL